MSDEFRELLKKIGSGTHTGKNLSRQEAELATSMILQQQATPAQIGAFFIAHRIKRPTPEELAGMLDACDKLGPTLKVDNLERTPVVLGNPYDGRSRTAPVTPITALMLAAADVPVIMHGGDRMPTKYGIPSIKIWQGLGVDFTCLSLSQIEALLTKTKLGFVYLRQHFPLAYELVPYREQIGKRPPLATLELVWSPVPQNMSLVSGFVHPPTEERFIDTFRLRGVTDYTTVKGLEGSCDLSCSRTAIIGIGTNADFTRLHLNPRDYDLGGQDPLLESEPWSIEQLEAVLAGKNNELMAAAILNGGFYLWRFGVCPELAAGFALAETMLTKGEVAAKLDQLKSSYSLVGAGSG